METMSRQSLVNLKWKKGRLLSASSKSGINLKEFNRLKFENERYKHIIGQMVEKFMNFKQSITRHKLWKSNECNSNLNADSRNKEENKHDYEQIVTQENQITTEENSIIGLKREMSQKDKFIVQLTAELKQLKSHS